MKWYFQALLNFFDFKGRSRRKEFWMFTFIHLLLSIIAIIIDYEELQYRRESIFLYFGVFTFYSLIAFLPAIAVTVRRLHDIGKSGLILLLPFISSVILWILKNVDISTEFLIFLVIILLPVIAVIISKIENSKANGWLILILLIPIIGSVWIFIELLIDSQPGKNQYGENPKGINKKKADFEKYYLMGLEKYDNGNYKNAINDFNLAIEINPKNPDLYSSRADALFESGDKLKAINDYSKAINLDPSYAAAYINRGIAKKDLGDIQGACADWKKAAELGLPEAQEMIKHQCK